ncbi:hypothetical protein M8C21_025621, partial [Ambrosia artemisiifolia]
FLVVVVHAVVRRTGDLFLDEDADEAAALQTEKERDWKVLSICKNHQRLEVVPNVLHQREYQVIHRNYVVVADPLYSCFYICSDQQILGASVDLCSASIQRVDKLLIRQTSHIDAPWSVNKSGPCMAWLFKVMANESGRMGSFSIQLARSATEEPLYGSNTSVLEYG